MEGKAAGESTLYPDEAIYHYNQTRMFLPDACGIS
jgi:hypothetical protein